MWLKPDSHVQYIYRILKKDSLSSSNAGFCLMQQSFYIRTLFGRQSFQPIDVITQNRKSILNWLIAGYIHAGDPEDIHRRF